MPYPYVSNEAAFGQGFLDSFTQLYGIASNRKRQKEQDRIATEDREFARELQLAGLAGQGIFPGTAPAEEPAPPHGTGFRSAFVAREPQRPGARPMDEVPSYGGNRMMGSTMGPPTLDEMTAVEDSAEPPKPRPPGAFDPMTMSFTPALPRFRQVTPGLYQDSTRTPKARERAEAAAERSTKVQRYITAGLSPRDAEIAADDAAFGRSRLDPDASTPRNMDPLSPEGQAAYLARLEAELKLKKLYDTGAAGGKPTEGQRRGQMLHAVAKEALPILNDATAPGYLEALAQRAGRNELLDEDRQVIDQAARQFTSSYLYLVSGATASPQEVDNLTSQIVPQLGDKPPVLARKRQALRTMIDAMASFAGAQSGPSLAPQASPSDSSGLQPLTPEQAARMKADPEYAAFKRSQGYR